jgi:hypothetical protein
MAKRKLSDGMPTGTYVCVSKSEDNDAICFSTNEISGLLEKLATNATPSP